MQNQSNIASSNENNPIRALVRGVYDLQKQRIQCGNRITVNFKAKLGQTQDGMSEKELEKQEQDILNKLRQSYARITDGIVEGGKLPTLKKFKGDEVISTYAELVLVRQYMSILGAEEEQFDLLTKVMTGIPIYDEFLSNVAGIGPAMAGIILSEIDITKAEYPSSLWKYAGLDCVTVARYKDDAGKEHVVPARVIEAHYSQTDAKFLAEGKYEVQFYEEGRSRKDTSLVDRAYITKEGKEDFRKSITFNPFLKTKLVGVMGTSFLRTGKVIVDGARLGGAKRASMAKAEGYAGDEKDGDAVIAFLRSKSHTVVEEYSPYAQAYYDYRNRLDNDPRHISKSDAHKHAMAIRYAVKRFLVDLYSNWRRLSGLTVSTEYSVGKLGMVHKQAKAA